MPVALLTRTHFMQLVDRLVMITAITAPFHESGLMQHEAYRGQLSRIGQQDYKGNCYSPNNYIPDFKVAASEQLGYSKKLIKPGLLESSHNELYTRETSSISLLSGQGLLACALITCMYCDSTIDKSVSLWLNRFHIESWASDAIYWSISTTNLHRSSSM